MSATALLPEGWGREFKATLRLAWPLILAQIAQIAFFTTDVYVMGQLGRDALAAISLATSLLHPLVVGGFGVATAAAPMISQAIGAREWRSIRRTVRQGFWVMSLVSVLIIPVLLFAYPLFIVLGQPDGASAGAALYLTYAAWSVPFALLFSVLRALIASKGDTGVILIITVVAVILNAILNYLLVFGNFGFPRLELAGAGIATVIANALMFFAALAYGVWHRRYKRHYILVRFFKPDWPRFFEFFRIGLPIGLTLMSEVGLFGVAVIMMGWLGTDEVAAHIVAIQCAAVTFMVPLGLSQATTIRVGLAYGAGNREGVATSGWSSLALTLAFMVLTCAVFILFPHFLATLFLNPADPANALSISLAVSYLLVAAAFQFVDGTQVAMAAALRGLSDTRVPMVVALLGYWVVGLGIAYLAGFTFGMEGVGIWIGLASGLAFVGVVLLARWAMRERLGLLGPRPLAAPMPV